MKKNFWLLVGILICLAVAVSGYFWAQSSMSSVFGYRSPLHDTPPAAGAPLGQALSQRVVIVLIDALRYDTSLNAQVMPVLNRLRAQGASALMHSQAPSYSEPGYTTILTGAWPSLNDGPMINLEYEQIPVFTQDDIFSAAHRIGLQTAISGYYWFERLVPQQAVSAGFYTPGEDAAADEEVTAAALPMLADGYQLVLIHLDQVDYAGHHEGGPRDPRWDAAAGRADSLLGEIVSSLDFDSDTLIVLSDHGQIDRGGHGGPEPVVLREPFVMIGAGVRPGAYPDIQQVDVAPTVAALLGTNIPASAQGRVLTSMLVLSPEYEAKIRAAEIAQKRALFQAYVTAIGSQPRRQPDAADAGSYLAAMNDAFQRRLGRERLVRALPVLLLALLPAGLMIFRREKQALWLALGALLYVFLFHFRYAVLDGRTYSLSSVESQEWLLSFVGVTALLALAVAWLTTMLSLRAFRGGARTAAATSLGFVLVTLYLLALPILFNAAWNGLVTTWALPEFYSAYIALLSLIQWIIVAAGGLVLTGVSAVVGKVVKRT